ETTQDIPDLSPGLYNVTITNEQGCAQTINGIEVEDGNSDFSIVNYTSTPASCETADGTIIIQLDTDVFPVSFELYDEETGAIYTIGNSITANAGPNTFGISGIEAGTYNIAVASSTGCVQTLADMEVNEPDQVDLQVPTEIEACGSQAIITANS